MKRIQRQLPLLRSVLTQANQNKRQQLLQHANADQINAVSELVLNTLKSRVPLTPPLVLQLGKHKNVLRELSKRKNSVKRRRQHLLTQKGLPFGKVSTAVYVSVWQSKSTFTLCYKKLTRRLLAWKRL